MGLADEMEQEFTEFFQQMAKNKGIDELTSKLMALLYLEPGELSMDELAEKTGYSLASMSNKLKALEGIGMVRRHSRPGSKKCYFTMPKKLFEMMKQHFIKTQNLNIKLAKEKLPGLISRYDGKINTKKGQEQMNIIKSYYEDVKQFGELLDKIMGIIEKEVK